MVIAAALLGSVSLTGCGMGGDSMDKKEEKTSSTGTEAKSSGLAPSWLPSEASSIKVMQRTTGAERLLMADMKGALPKQCTAIKTKGAPTDAELKAAYAQDTRTKDSATSDIATAPLLSADWWPAGQEKETTALCGRWWVSVKDGHVYAFAAEQQRIADQIIQERKK